MAFLNSIINLGFPEKKLSNNDISNLFPSWTSEKILSKLGIEERFVCPEGFDSVDLSLKAVLEFSKWFDLKKIDFVIYVSNSSRHIAPGDGHLLLKKLNHLFLSPGCIDVNLGCSGYVYALGLATSLVNSFSFKNILIITSDHYSKYIKDDDKSNMSILGDAATVSLISDIPITKECWEVKNFLTGSNGLGYDDLNICRSQGGDKDRLYMDGPAIFKFTSKEIVDFILNQNLNVNDFIFVFHQANEFILNYMKEKLNISDSNFIVDLKLSGNTVSSSIPIAMARNISKLNYKRIFLCGFGIGASYASLQLWPI